RSCIVRAARSAGGGTVATVGSLARTSSLLSGAAVVGVAAVALVIPGSCGALRSVASPISLLTIAAATAPVAFCLPLVAVSTGSRVSSVVGGSAISVAGCGLAARPALVRPPGVL
ncbi:unnamed protein product, partial [Ectocarpus fasciculatus]